VGCVGPTSPWLGIVPRFRHQSPLGPAERVTCVSRSASALVVGELAYQCFQTLGLDEEERSRALGDKLAHGFVVSFREDRSSHSCIGPELPGTHIVMHLPEGRRCGGQMQWSLATTSIRPAFAMSRMVKGMYPPRTHLALRLGVKRACGTPVVRARHGERLERGPSLAVSSRAALAL